MHLYQGLTNLDLEFKVKGWSFGIWFQISKNKKRNIKIFKIKRVYFGHFIFWVLFLWQNLKNAIWDNFPFKYLTFIEN